MHITVLAVSLTLMAVIAAIFISAARSAGRGEAIQSVETRRNRLIVALTVIGVVVSLVSLVPWPHAVSAAPAAVVNVTGGQWYWKLDTGTVPAGRPVAFNVRTADVTHGLAVVDENGRIVFQTQAIPGYVTRVDHKFTKPGTYRVICLEYCGVAHHGMFEQLTVVAD